MADSAQGAQAPRICGVCGPVRHHSSHTSVERSYFVSVWTFSPIARPGSRNIRSFRMDACQEYGENMKGCRGYNGPPTSGLRGIVCNKENPQRISARILRLEVNRRILVVRHASTDATSPALGSSEETEKDNQCVDASPLASHPLQQHTGVRAQRFSPAPRGGIVVRPITQEHEPRADVQRHPY